MFVRVITPQNTYEYEPQEDGYWSELEFQAADADTPHTFRGLLSTKHPVDQLHLQQGDMLDIHGAINRRANYFLVAYATRVEQPAL